jgi:5'-nucleotidase
MSLGYVIADAQRAAAERHEGRTVDLAFLNPGGVRADLAPLDASGAVDFGQIYSVQPFGGGLVAMTLSGAEILELLEQQWRANGQQALLLPSSTLRYAWRGSAPLGHRVDRASVRLHGAPLDEARDYRVVVNAFLANSGDGFERFAEGRERVQFGLDREALIDYLSAGPPVPLPAMGPETGRIRRLD